MKMGNTLANANTAAQPKDAVRAEFLARRRSGIGGSDVGIIMGVNPWRTPYDLWLDKTGNAEPTEETQYQHFGQMLEQVIADEFAERNQVKVQRRNNMFRKIGTPLVANIDRYIIGGGILECKTCDKWAADKFGEDGTDEVPETYLLQVQHYMYVTGIHAAFLAVLIGGNEYRQYEIPYNAELAEFCARKCCEWWETYINGNTPPPATVRDDLAKYFRAEAGKSVTATPDALDKIAAARTLKAEIKQRETDLDNLLAEIKLFAGDAEIILGTDGKPAATWKQQKDRQTTDWKALAESFTPTPDRIGEYTTTKAGNRPLILK